MVIAGAGIVAAQDGSNSGDDNVIVVEVEEQAESSNFGSDLIARNIQRGRAHSGGAGSTFTVWRGSEP